MSSELIEMIILGGSMVLFLITGIILTIKGIKKEDKSLIWLAIAYFMLIFLFVVWGLSLFGNYALIYAIQTFVFIPAVIFTKLAFYQDKKSAYKIILTGTIVFGILQVVQKLFEYTGLYDEFFESFFYSVFDNIISILWTAIPFGWMAYSALKARKELITQKVQPWITNRLLLVAISALIEIFVSFPDLMNSITEANIRPQMWYLQIFIIVSFIIINFLAWAMPSGFKNLLNRGYVGPNVGSEDEKKLSEEEILAQLMEVYNS